jgi:hypothetical protein
MTDVHDKMLLDYDPVTQRKVEVEQKDGKLLVHESIPKGLLDAYIERNKKEYNAVSHKGYKNALKKAKFWRAASIPNIICEKWLKEEGIDIFNEEDWPKIQAKLNSEEYKFLRTSPGKI